LNQSIAAARPLSALPEEPPLNPLSVNGLRLPPAEPIIRAVLPQAANASLALGRKNKKINVLVSLTNGERVLVESFDDEEPAKVRARELTQVLETAKEWPLIGERLIRPDAVVSVDLEKSSK
jgi:hypothetical protein